MMSGAFVWVEPVAHRRSILTPSLGECNRDPLNCKQTQHAQPNQRRFLRLSSRRPLKTLHCSMCVRDEYASSFNDDYL